VRARTRTRILDTHIFHAKDKSKGNQRINPDMKFKSLLET